MSLVFWSDCAVGPDDKTPEITLSARFLDQESVEQREIQNKTA